MAEAQPSGVRLAFRTAATAIELDTHRTVVAYRGAPPRPEGVYDLVVDGALVASASTTGGTVVTVDMTTGAGETGPGPGRHGALRRAARRRAGTSRSGCRTNETTRARGPARGRAAARHRRRNGAGVAAPRQLHQPRLRRREPDDDVARAWRPARGGVELVNLGFGGSALLDPFVARARSATPRPT